MFSPNSPNFYSWKDKEVTRLTWNGLLDMHDQFYNLSISEKKNRVASENGFER